MKLNTKIPPKIVITTKCKGPQSKTYVFFTFEKYEIRVWIMNCFLMKHSVDAEHSQTSLPSNFHCNRTNKHFPSSGRPQDTITL